MAIAIFQQVITWFLSIHPALAIFIVSFLISLFSTVAIKLLTNQSLMRDLRDEMKDLQKEMKTLRNNPKKLTEINTRFMETNMKYMSHSMRPTIYTFIPLFLIFGWLNAHFAYYPLVPDTPFTVSLLFGNDATGDVTMTLPDNLFLHNPSDPLIKTITDHKVSWELTGYPIVSDYYERQLNFTYMNSTHSKNVLITYYRSSFPPDYRYKLYAPVVTDFRSHVLIFTNSNPKGLDEITLSNTKIQPFNDVPVLKDIPWVNSWSWLGAYIVFSLLFSMVLRKVFNIY